jgi:hypothetical protein
LYDKIRMNASDIVKAKQNRTLFQAYYHPAITPTTSTITFSTITNVSSIYGVGVQSTVCSTVVYNGLCIPSFISYQLANDVNQGKYLCNTYTLARQVGADTVLTTSTAVNLCTLSNLQWKNVNSTLTYAYAPIYGNPPQSTISTFRAVPYYIQTGPLPVICPIVDFYQGTNFTSKCNVCPQNGPCTC